MPGLRLTPDQVQRLCGVDRTVCQMVLDTLVDMKFLGVTRDGAYVRLSEGAETSASAPRDAPMKPLRDRPTVKRMS